MWAPTLSKFQLGRPGTWFAFVITALVGCSGLGSAKPYQPKSPPEFRTAAASIMGKDVNNVVPPDPDNPNPAVDLLPTPGKAPLIGNTPQEVLRSNPKSGAYIAFIGQMPPTRYFTVLGRADCDEWVYLQLMNSDMLRANPAYYGGGKYGEDKPAFRCQGIFHKKFRDKTDDRLVGSDGVVFDPESAVFTNLYGWINQERKIHMDGWAIKFAEPTKAMIRERLKVKAVLPIDVMQMRAAAFWIEKNGAKDLSTEIRALLPVHDKKSALSSWRGADHPLLKALAVIESESEPDDIFRTILDAGIAEMLRPGSLVTVAHPSVQDAPMVAANVIACRNQSGARDHLRRVLNQATIRQHKLASVKALIAMGDNTYLNEQLQKGALGDITGRVANLLAGKEVDAFSCPYRNFNHGIVQETR